MIEAAWRRAIGRIESYNCRMVEDTSESVRHRSSSGERDPGVLLDAVLADLSLDSAEKAAPEVLIPAMETARTRILQLTPQERNAIFLEARRRDEELLPEGTHTFEWSRRRFRLAILLHPSVQVLEAMLNDRQCFDDFVRYISLSSEYRAYAVPHDLIPGATSIFSHEDRHEVAAKEKFVREYYRIVYDCHAADYPFVELNGKKIVFFPRPSEEDMLEKRDELMRRHEGDAADQIKKEILKETSQHIKTIRVSEGPLLETFYPGIWEDRLDSDTSLALVEAIESLSLFDIEEVAHGNLHSIRYLVGIFQSVTRDAGWPKFEMSKAPPELSMLLARDVVYSFNNNAIAALQLRHRESIKEPLALLERMRETKNGLLPLGLKIHCISSALTRMDHFPRGGFTLENAGTCYNLPPVGSFEAAEEFLSVLQKRSGVNFLDNQYYELQVCLRGELPPEGFALLSIVKHLGSDKIRVYNRSSFKTSHEKASGRMVIPGGGMYEGGFPWWNKTADGKLKIDREPPEWVGNRAARTDVLCCKSLRDIRNVQIAGTLLMYAHHGGFWQELGEDFTREIRGLLKRYNLAHTINNSWIPKDPKSFVGRARLTDDEIFFRSLEDITKVALSEADGTSQASKRRQGILYELQEIIQHYENENKLKADEALKDYGKR